MPNKGIAAGGQTNGIFPSMKDQRWMWNDQLSETVTLVQLSSIFRQMKALI